MKCIVKGCHKPVWGYDMCHEHAYMAVGGRLPQDETADAIPEERLCNVSGCMLEKRSEKYCTKHYQYIVYLGRTEEQAVDLLRKKANRTKAEQAILDRKKVYRERMRIANQDTATA